MGRRHCAWLRIFLPFVRVMLACQCPHAWCFPLTAATQKAWCRSYRTVVYSDRADAPVKNQAVQAVARYMRRFKRWGTLQRNVPQLAALRCVDGTHLIPRASSMNQGCAVVLRYLRVKKAPSTDAPGRLILGRSGLEEVRSEP